MNRRFLVALLLALLLPLAQLAAAAHEVSHVRGADSKSTPAAVHCDLCALGAAVTGGGAVSEPPVLAHAPARHVLSPTEVPAPPATERIALFLSRAPPFRR
jgi:hypothetical protein